MATSGNKRNPKVPLSTEAVLLKSKKIGLGTLTHPETARWNARVILFARMRELMPDDLRKLKASAVPLYKELHELGRKVSPMNCGNVPALMLREKLPDGTESVRGLHVESWSTLSQAADFVSEAKVLATTILQWSDHLHMVTDWFMDAALKNLWGWSLQAEGAELTWTYPGTYMALQHGHQVGAGDMRIMHGWGNLDRLVPPPLIKPYNPSTQTRKQHLSDLLADVNRYHRDQEEQFKKATFSPATSKRKRAGLTQWGHFDWFIEYQMRGRKHEDVGHFQGGEPVGASAISRALAEVADLLEVTLRSRTKVNLS